MVQITINLPAEIGIARAGTSVTVDVTKISATIWARLAEHGLVQKVGDSAAGSAKASEEAGMPQTDFARQVMLKTLDTLMKGDWGVARASGVDEFTKVGLRLTEVAIVAAKGKEWAKSMTDEAKAEYVAEKFAKNREKLTPAIEKEIARLEAQRAEKKAIAGMVEGELEL